MNLFPYHQCSTRGLLMSDLRSWSDLPQEVLNLIRQRLFRRDYSNFRSTCRDWNFRAAFDEAVYDRVDSPLLLGFTRSGTDHDGGSSLSCCCEAYSPAKEKTYYISAHSKLFDAQIHCSRYGWLLFSSLNHLFFYHPSTQDTIDLPDLGSYLAVPRINRMSFSAPPTSADCVVFCLGDIHSNKEVYVAFIRRGQRSWNLYADGVRNVMKWTGARPRKLVARKIGTIRVKSSPCRAKLQHSVGKFWWSNSNCSPVFHNGAFYCLAQDGRLGVLDPKQKAEKKMWRILDTFLEEEARSMLYLVECRGKLICIVVGRMGEFVRIYKLYEPTKQWQPVANLGDEMIFVGHAGYCNSVMTCDDDEELKNTIHFPIFHESGRHHVFYSLSTQQFHSFEPGHPSIDDLYDAELMLNRAWTIPNFQFLAGSQLRWSSKPKKRPRIAEDAAEPPAECRGYRIHPHYVIRNLSFSLEHKQSEDDDDDVGERREEQEARRPFLTLSNEEGEEMLVDLAKVRPTADHPRNMELAARTRGKQVYSSTVYGILVMMDAEARRCSLLDLKSMTETTLPTWETPFTCSNAILHSSPGGGSKFTVMVFGEIERQREAESDAFAMLWRDGDSEWTVHTHMVKGSKPNVTATIHKGKIYGFPKKRLDMVSIELTPERYTSKPVPKLGFPSHKCPKGSDQLQETLVECGGELLRFVKFETPGRYGEVMDIQAFKLDLQMMVWKEVEHLGDRAFFWSDLGCYSCRATKFGFQKNSIYYLEWEERNLYRFDYTNRSVTISQPDPVVVDDSWVPGGFIMG